VLKQAERAVEQLPDGRPEVIWRDRFVYVADST
jgi:hypothetical protein